MNGAPTQAGSHDSLSLWLTLQRLPGAGLRTQHELLAHFGSVGKIFSAGRGLLEQVLTGKNAAINAILSGPDPAALKPDF